MAEKIEHLLFDLDNTLYPSSAPITQKMNERFVQFVSDYLNISPEEATIERKSGLSRFGTTLEWLKKEKGLKNEDVFFKSVHPEEEINEVSFDPNLRDYLLSLKMPMSILTNSPYEHAERILKKLKIFDLFKVIFDLRANNLNGKPAPESYFAPIKAAGFSVEQTLFVDDTLRYVKGFDAIGGKAVLIDENNRFSINDWDGLRINSIYNLKSLLS
ncbi:MAG: HAD-IA family hydrolase [Treponema sp.]|jgi:putative hydrolase of the HAD superfamily|nr:HAD-IA family hydrolase [Treponema sp.]